jgi:hypothetical protein
MLTAKIKVDETYAVNHRGELERFEVDEVTIVKKGGNKDEVTVNGRYLNDGGAARSTLRASALLGPYREFTALIAQEAAQKAAKERAEQEAKAEHERVWKRLYELTGLPVPVAKKAGTWGPEYDRDEDVFQRSYGGGFSVSSVGARALLLALERAPRFKVVG